MECFELKLTRAEYHIADAENAFATWLGNGYRVFEEPNNNGRFELKAEILKGIPDEIPLIIGDAFHCLRDCLDHIIFYLAEMNGPLSGDDEGRLMFPIPRRNVVDAFDGRITKLSDTSRKAVIDLLPDPGRDNFNTHPLVILDKMNNRDKHRKISLICATSAIYNFALMASDGSDYFHIVGPAKPKVGEPAVTFLEFARSNNVKAEIGFSTQIIFDEGVEASGIGVFDIFNSIRDYIRNPVITTLI